MCGRMGVEMCSVGIDVFVMMLVVWIALNIVMLMIYVGWAMIVIKMRMGVNIVGTVGVMLGFVSVVVASMRVIVTMAMMSMPESSQADDIDHKPGRTHN